MFVASFGNAEGVKDTTNSRLVSMSIGSPWVVTASAPPSLSVSWGFSRWTANMVEWSHDYPVEKARLRLMSSALAGL